MSNDRTVLVTGGNRGIGLAICKGLADRGLNVVLGARNEDKGKGAAASIRGRGGSMRVEQLDVIETASIAACKERLDADDVTVDVLINKGILIEIRPIRRAGGPTRLGDTGRVKTTVRRLSAPLVEKAGRSACGCFAARTESASVLTFTVVPDPKQRSIPTNGKATIRSTEIDRPFVMGRTNGRSGEVETAYERFTSIRSGASGPRYATFCIPSEGSTRSTWRAMWQSASLRST